MFPVPLSYPGTQNDPISYGNLISLAVIPSDCLACIALIILRYPTEGPQLGLHGLFLPFKGGC